jgi:anaerobic selenocysteine-containing dehydrogenase
MNGVGEPCSTMYRSSLPPANSSQCSAGDVYRVVRALFYPRETMIEVLQLAASLAREHDGALSASLVRDATGAWAQTRDSDCGVHRPSWISRFQRDLHHVRHDSRLHDPLKRDGGFDSVLP